MTSATADGLPPAAPTSNPILATLQRIGRSLMLPIAVMPAAGLLIRLGSDDVLGERTPGDTTQHGLYLATATGAHWLIYVEQVFAAAGNGIFNFLPLLFAIGVAVGFARRADGSTALAAAVGYLVYNEVTAAIFQMPVNAGHEWITNWYGTDKTTGKVNFTDTIAKNPTYVLGGILVGILAAILYQRYYRIKLPPYLAFFGGRRFVPIATAFASVILGVVVGLIWQWPAAFINWLGKEAASNGTAGAGIFGLINRLLLPFGLHHIPNNIVWTSAVGGTCQQKGVQYAGDLVCFFHGSKSSGMFMTGFFPIMMFALPAAAFAMTRAARPDRRKLVGGIMLSAALCSFLTGVTEPIEFAFLFAAPALFGIHAVLTGASLALCQALGIHDGFSFSAGLFDYLFNFDIATKPLWLIPIGIGFAIVYYFLFTFAIKTFNIQTPGREADADAEAEAPVLGAPVAG
ncbi:MAG TPA: PTS transporter subunit EIIC [Actinocrinis sp.]|jgi:PTS system N-acetylglucosamine-specific IIC component|uniref:PTS transporter subunit EIIC n=1 Tax=Actinocrinis sp. TaxID=1920516 RepID=UPI002DDD4D76|nr:PTS transporter subunit EIIC [Actinocrinis sp.]HEV3169361.1 PTS transporter subunit EIIC [Actinocrinis sp.]